MKFPETPEWPQPPSPQRYTLALGRLTRMLYADATGVQSPEDLAHFVGLTHKDLIQVGLHNPNGVRQIAVGGTSAKRIVDKNARDMDFHNACILPGERILVIGFEQVNLAVDVQRFGEVSSQGATLSLVSDLSLFMPTSPLKQFVDYAKVEPGLRDRLRASRPTAGQVGEHYFPLSDTGWQEEAVRGFASVYQEIIQNVIEVAPPRLDS